MFNPTRSRLTQQVEVRWRGCVMLRSRTLMERHSFATANCELRIANLPTPQFLAGRASDDKCLHFVIVARDCQLQQFARDREL